MTGPKARERRLRPAWIGLALVLWAASSQYHLVFSNLIVRPLSTPWGEVTLKGYAAEGALALGAVFLVWLVMRARRRRAGSGLAVPGVLLLGLIALANGLFMATPVENIHFPQYALIAAVFVRGVGGTRAARFARTLFWVTVLGVLDEAYQYLYITRDYGDYLDFNDFLLNQAGAALGLLMSLPEPRSVLRSLPRVWLESAPELVFLAVSMSALLGCWLAGVWAVTPPGPVPPGGVLAQAGDWTLFLEREPGMYGSWRPNFFEGRFFVIPPAAGAAAMVLLGALLWVAAVRAGHPPRERAGAAPDLAAPCARTGDASKVKAG